jgi:acetylornithine/N-succinyldiaminopimelate aminotransferase
MDKLKEIPSLLNIRGRGLMIGFDVPDSLKDLKKNLLFKHHIFTGEAKPNVIRLLPSLALTKDDADIFLEAIRAEIEALVPSTQQAYN